MIVESQQLGPLDVPEDQLIDFPLGLPGFPAMQRFCLVQAKPGSRFQLLQSAERAGLAFVTTDPLGIDPDYPTERLTEQVRTFGMSDEQLAFAAIVTAPPAPARPTVNMLAPLVIGMRSRKAFQIVIHDGPYRVRHEL